MGMSNRDLRPKIASAPRDCAHDRRRIRVAGVICGKHANAGRNIFAALDLTRNPATRVMKTKPFHAGPIHQRRPTRHERIAE